MGYKLAMRCLVFYLVKIFTYLSDTSGISHGNDGRGQFLGAKIEMIHGTARIDN
jgi:hypothetical protein